ncbi:Hypp5144 [Branchiostoma lanceolatum]|uniref:Hypp5144 protein n=1 Tax=Branchiostoma lanceolatum TaxID=7740 RepID=A0A8K0ADH5_BRALA|nr:Hypp5144 [Branchiostoma lanceolatum]
MVEGRPPQPPPIFADRPADHATAPAEVQHVSRSHVLGLRRAARCPLHRVMRRAPAHGDRVRESPIPPSGSNATSSESAGSEESYSREESGANHRREHRNSPQQQKPGIPP